MYILLTKEKLLHINLIHINTFIFNFKLNKLSLYNNIYLAL